MPNKKFLRRNTDSLSKLGKLRKKLQKWRRPKGRDNKMRLKMKSRAPVVSVGYIQDKKQRGKIDEKTPIMVFNVKDLSEVKKDNVAILAKIGNKKRIEVMKAAKEKNIKFANYTKKIKEKKKK